MIKMTEEGYVFISESGIQYKLLEGKSIGAKLEYTSDIVFIMLDNYIAGYFYGAMVSENNSKDYEEHINDIINEFEKREGRQ